MVALITDTKKTVTSIQKKILPSCDEFSVQVGYFYFSGFEEIYKDLKNKKMKIIIGIDYDGKVGSAANSIAASTIKDNYFNSLTEDIQTNTFLPFQNSGPLYICLNACELDPLLAARNTLNPIFSCKWSTIPARVINISPPS